MVWPMFYWIWLNWSILETDIIKINKRYVMWVVNHIIFFIFVIIYHTNYTKCQKSQDASLSACRTCFLTTTTGEAHSDVDGPIFLLYKSWFSLSCSVLLYSGAMRDGCERTGTASPTSINCWATSVWPRSLVKTSETHWWSHLALPVHLGSG